MNPSLQKKNRQCFFVVFCHNVVEMATEWDVLIGTEYLRPYILVAQTDLVIPVKWEFLIENRGFVSEYEMEEMNRVTNNGEGAGSPLGSIVQPDPRRAFKEAERLRSLPFCNPVYAEQLGWTVK